MSHPIYSRQQLLNRGLLRVKKIAADHGILPTGDKRLIDVWVDAIIEHQAAQVQKNEVATIEFDNGIEGLVEPYTALIDGQETPLNGWSHEGLTQPYMVLVNGEVVHRATTYQLAERYCKWHSLRLVGQTLAQSELEAELEVQATARAEKAKFVQVVEQVEDEGFVKFIVQSNESFYTVTPAHPVDKQRCECGDNHFRGGWGGLCKHQIAVKEKIASQVSFISPDFGYHEAIVNNDVHHVIGTIEYFSDRDCDQPWWNVQMRDKSITLTSYEEAEKFIKDEYTEGVLSHRGSGRITQPIEVTNMTIEDTNMTHDFGQSYTLRVHNHLAGYIWLNDNLGWTLNGEDYQDDWRPVAKELVKLTRHEYLLAA